MEVVLRPYQQDCVSELRKGIAAGHRKQVLMAPAGAGKTEIAAFLVQESQRKFKRSAFVVDRVVLCDQTSERFDRYGIPHGVRQANHWRDRPYERVQVCSAQTIEKSGWPANLDFIVIDEAHCMRKSISERVKETNAVVIGLTATPFAKGMGDLYSNLVNVTTTNALIADGFLCQVKAYAAKSVDMTGAKVVAGEWQDSEIEKRGTEIIGDIVAEWVDKTRQHFGGPVKTIVFSATVTHGEEICRRFRDAGYNFQQISYHASEDSRKALIEEFRKADSVIHGLVSCEVFTKGFDVPDILCGISARPYRRSLSSHIQQLGRVMRPAPGKTFGLWLDHAGNYLRFYKDTADVFENGMQKLDDGEHDAKTHKEPTEKERAEIACSCGYILSPHHKNCPGCGKEIKRRSLIETLPGEMVEITGSNIAKLPAWMHDKEGVWFQLCSWSMGRKGEEATAKKLALAKYRHWYNEWPPRGIEFDAVRCAQSLELARKIKADNIKWAKTQDAAKRYATA
jgi:DNA repair protein RadD